LIVKGVGVEAKNDDKMKQLATEHNKTPIKILTVVLIEDGSD